MNANKKISIFIDASRNRSGGAIAHLKGILEKFDMNSDISELHVWGPKVLLERLPDRSWLYKHSHSALERSLIFQLWWQYKILQREIARFKCDILFSTDASTLCKFKPMVVLSQDLLSYEPGIMKTYSWGKARLRLEIIKRVQNSAFRRAAGVLFLTEYASKCVQASCGGLGKIALAPHGIDDAFRSNLFNYEKIFPQSRDKIECIYVSNTEHYKNQWNVVLAVKLLRDKGFPVHLTLVGGGSGKSQKMVEESISQCAGDSWVTQLNFLKHSELPHLLDSADIFVFASSCENLPVTLLEGMAKGMPIACSNRGPMPEVLEDGGVYFDPFEPSSIADAIAKLINSSDLRNNVIKKAAEKSELYTWSECSRATFRFICDRYLEFKNKEIEFNGRN